MKITTSVSRYKTSVQCFIPVSLLKQLGVTLGDKIQFEIKRGRRGVKLVGVPKTSEKKRLLLDMKVRYYKRHD